MAKRKRRDYGEPSPEETARYLQGEEVSSGPMAAAFAKVGITEGTDLKKVFGQAGTVAKELDELHRKAESLDPNDLRELERSLWRRAKEDADVLCQLYQSRAALRRLGGEDPSSPYARQLEEAEELITSIRGRNRFAREMADAAAKKYNRQAFRKRVERRQAAIREGIESIRAHTITLHEACAGTNGPVAVRIQYDFRVRDEQGRETGKEKRIGWLRLSVKKGYATPERSFLLPRGLQRILGLTEDSEEKPKTVPLRPPDFRTGRGEPFFPNVVRSALADLYKFEEIVAADKAATTGTVTQLLSGEAVRVVVYRSGWRERGEWNRPRSLKVDVEGDGQGNIHVHRVETTHKGWDDLVGKDFALTALPPQLHRFLTVVSTAESYSANEENEN